MNKEIRLYDIDWDVDEFCVEDLPKEVTIPAQKIIDARDMERLEECLGSYDAELADYLSDTYGFCVNSFREEIR